MFFTGLRVYLIKGLVFLINIFSQYKTKDVEAPASTYRLFENRYSVCRSWSFDVLWREYYEILKYSLYQLKKLLMPWSTVVWGL